MLGLSSSTRLEGKIVRATEGTVTGAAAYVAVDEESGAPDRAQGDNLSVRDGVDSSQIQRRENGPCFIILLESSRGSVIPAAG